MHQACDECLRDVVSQDSSQMYGISYLYGIPSRILTRVDPAQAPRARQRFPPPVMAKLNYTDYASRPHGPFSNAGPLRLPLQRPPVEERTYHSPAVEEAITDMTSQMCDKDLARLFENCYPNTLDTTVRWVSNSTDAAHIIAGDMDAAWLRDNLWQLQAYTSLLSSSDPTIKHLWRGVLYQQARWVAQSPYSNSFNPPAASGITEIAEHVVDMSQDVVTPPTDPKVTFEGKYGLDSLASFLRLSRLYVEKTADATLLEDEWLRGLKSVLKVLHEQSKPTFEESGRFAKPTYSFQRPSNLSMDCVTGGIGNPVNRGTGLIKSIFRASDDATILPFHIPSNAFVAVELRRIATLLTSVDNVLASECDQLGIAVEDGIYKHGVHQHPVYGAVFAYEVDGYGSHIFMDDASPPSLLSLPYLGFVPADNPVYVNTRRMVLSRKGNPYYVVGSELEGQGSPHINLETMWPIGTIVQALTTDVDDEIRWCLETLKKSSAGLGLIHEGVAVNDSTNYLRSWYAWGNSAFGELILDLADRKPEILFQVMP
ncbi:hypothetical protein PV08_05274 [Exophiala spinifera]|uniref:Metal-independent alpha-mannosidase n=1 Tax=Exophiala spinifera TaxID=91928 RepID=A0A0D2BVD0_9EURO|nr:uncharacterized protein PV08_05274 [Exophiala spinifera]KIW15229.1 hypothetical protein PV08_05274 [Exophiala spinifera]